MLKKPNSERSKKRPELSAKESRNSLEPSKRLTPHSLRKKPESSTKENLRLELQPGLKNRPPKLPECSLKPREESSRLLKPSKQRGREIRKTEERSERNKTDLNKKEKRENSEMRKRDLLRWRGKERRLKKLRNKLNLKLLRLTANLKKWKRTPKKRDKKPKENLLRSKRKRPESEMPNVKLKKTCNLPRTRPKEKLLRRSKMMLRSVSQLLLKIEIELLLKRLLFLNISKSKRRRLRKLLRPKKRLKPTKNMLKSKKPSTKKSPERKRKELRTR
jgi:hypothetical protein